MEMQNSQLQENKPIILDTALICLVRIAHILGIPADMGQLKRAYVFSDEGMDAVSLIRAAKELGLKASQMHWNLADLSRVPMPAIAVLENGNFILILGINGNKITFSDPYYPQPLTIELEQFSKAWAHELILVARRFTLEKEEKKFGFNWFIPAIFRYKRFLLDVLVVSLALQLIGLLSPILMQNIIDKVLIHRSVNTLDVFIAGMVLVALFQVGLSMLRSYLFTHTTNKIDVTLSSKLFRHIMALPLKYFETWQVGEIVSRVRELETIQRFLTGSSLTILLDVVFALVYLVAMFLYSSTLSFVALSILPLFILLSLIATPIFKRLLNERFLLNAANQAYLIESITGVQTIKSLATEWTVIQKWEDMLARYVKTALSTTNLGNIVGNIAAFLQQLFNLSILWFGAKAVIAGTLTIGELVAFQMLAGQVIAPVLRLINMWQSMQQTLVSVNRVGDILNEGIELTFNPNRTTLPKIQGEVNLDRVLFRYRPDGPEILRHVDLHIQAGMKVGIVGRSGSGKSTLTKVVQRLYIPESGRVMMDGVDLAQVEPAWLRRQVGVVLQENFLFSGTIKENIAIAMPQATDEEIVKAAMMAGAHSFIMESPQGYDTQVGERGASLSGGQRQRIAIARALMTNPSVLIFDEATSALDYESERIIMDNLKIMAQGRTMIMIAHRLSTVQQCDKIVFMDHGAILEQGTHAQLMEAKGHYYQLYMQQKR